MNQLAITMIVTNVRNIKTYQHYVIFALCFHRTVSMFCFVLFFAMVDKHLKHFK